jgi:general nucleoside transport system ATP-binding protein
VLVVSQDLDELLMLTDRLAVINVGVLSEPMPTASASVEEIGLLMGGAHGMTAATEATAAGGLAHVA